MRRGEQDGRLFAGRVVEPGRQYGGGEDGETYGRHHQTRTCNLLSRQGSYL